MIVTVAETTIKCHNPNYIQLLVFCQWLTNQKGSPIPAPLTTLCINLRSFCSVLWAYRDMSEFTVFYHLYDATFNLNRDHVGKLKVLKLRLPFNNKNMENFQMTCILIMPKLVFQWQEKYPRGIFICKSIWVEYHL